MKTPSALALLFLAALHVCAGPFSDLNLAAASKQASESNKIILIDFYATWCAASRLLEKRTFTDAAVIQELESKTVGLRLDAEKETNLASRYQIESYPTVLLLRPDGTEMDRMVGFSEPTDFLAYFKIALEGKKILQAPIFQPPPSSTNPPMHQMYDAQKLARKGDDAAALAEFLWCFDNGAKLDPSFVGVRLSFLLDDIRKLGRTYPPAIKALEERRNAREAAVLAGRADRDAVMELVSLNKTLKQNERNLAVYDRLPAGSGERGAVRELIADQLLEAKRYADVLDGSDGKAAFSKQVGLFKHMTDSLDPNNPVKDTMENSYQRFTIKLGTQYFEALAGLNRDDEGKTLADQILKFDNSADTRAALARAAQQAGNEKLADYVKP